MKVRNAEDIINKTQFSNYGDWQIYPTADYVCDKCKHSVSINYRNLQKHLKSNFSNLTDVDQQSIHSLLIEISGKERLSFLDFYCPTCNRAVRIYYEYYAGGRHAEESFLLRYVVD